MIAEVHAHNLSSWKAQRPRVPLHGARRRHRGEPERRQPGRTRRPDHPRHVAAFVGEVLGGPKVYSGELGGHPHMIRRHLGRQLTEEQRARWMQLLLACADEVGVPDDPEFRSAFVAYLEWGTRLAVINSRPGASVDDRAPMPQWGWGVPGGPYVPSEGGG